MPVQIIDCFKNRTEYRLLKNYFGCISVNINQLQNGVLVIPGILLNRLKGEEITILNGWLGNSQNGLIFTPAWNEVDLRDIIDSTISIEIKKCMTSFESIPVEYEIRTLAKDILFHNNDKLFGIRYRRNTGSGLITVTTLPLLDYRLLQFENKFRSLFKILLNGNKNIEQNLKVPVQKVELDNIDIYLIILSGAEINLNDNPSYKLKKFFGCNIDKDTIKQKLGQLTDCQYICNSKLTQKGIDIAKEKNLKAFIKVVKERNENKDGWD